MSEPHSLETASFGFEDVPKDEKAPMVRRAVEGDRSLPAGRLDPAGELVWLVTEDAARELPAAQR